MRANKQRRSINAHPYHSRQIQAALPLAVEPLEQRMLLSAAANLGQILSPAATTPTVTYTMSINDDGTGHFSPGSFAVYAADTSDNGGLASYSVDVGGGVATITNDSPKGNYDDGTGQGTDDEMGFTLVRSANDTTPVTALQDTFGYSNGSEVILIYGFGQTAGNLAADAPHGSTGAQGSTTQAVYGAPLELIQGTFVGSAPTFVNTGADTGNVFLTHSGYNTEPPTLAFNSVTVPNPAAHTPAFSNLSPSSSIGNGTATASFSGTIAAGTFIPPGNETVAITLNSVTEQAPIQANGNFSATFDTSALQISSTPYQVTYAYAGDANFNPVTDNTTTSLTVTKPVYTGSIAGTIYADLTHSGVWNPTDPEQPDVMVYIDANNSGKLEAGDMSVNTNAVGNYLFTDLPSGTYTIREVAPGNYTQTSPAPTIGAITVTLSSGQAVTGQTFLNAPIGGGTEMAVYRLYSPVTLEHLYTADPNEYNTLEQYVGTWSGEGEVFNEYSAQTVVDGVADEPLYRLYDAADQQHFWTDDYNEYNTLRQAPWNWNDEGIAGYVFPTAVAGIAPTPLYRMMAPQVHLWTTDVNEYDSLVSDGWTQEGIIGYVL